MEYGIVVFTVYKHLFTLLQISIITTTLSKTGKKASMLCYIAVNSVLPLADLKKITVEDR